MKISELTNKSFLGSTGAAENSYVLINYEDSETDAPVTYKATLQELGRAIANDQQLYKKTQNGAVTTTTNNGAYVNGTAENFASVGAINSAVNGLASTGYVTNAISNVRTDILATSAQNTIGGHIKSDILAAVASDFISQGALAELASTGYVTNVVSGLASTGYVTDAIDQKHIESGGTKVADNYLKYYSSTNMLNNITLNMISGADGYVTSAIGDYAHTNQLATASYVESMVEGLTSTGDISDTIDNLKSQIVDYSGHGVGDIGETLYELYNNNGNASIGYVDDAVSGLASTGYVTNAVANAGGGSFNPLASVACSVMHNNVLATNNLYPLMMLNGSSPLFYTKNAEDSYFDELNIITQFDIPTPSTLAYISTSDNKPCIRDAENTFIGFLSTT